VRLKEALKALKERIFEESSILLPLLAVALFALYIVSAYCGLRLGESGQAGSPSWVFAFFSGIGPYAGLFLTLYAVFAAVVIFFENKNPDRTIAWMLILLFLPVVGFVLYFLFGPNLNKRAAFRELKHKKSAIMQRWAEDELRALESMAASVFPWKTVISLLKTSMAPLTFRNALEVLTNGDATFSAIKNSLSEAERFIHMEYFSIANDGIGNEIRGILERKAKEGLRVRLIYDSVGSWNIGKDYIESLKSAGVEVYPFAPISLPMLRRKLNHRNHRKIIVIDGKVGFMGGLNIGDKYLSRDRRFGFWRDTHLKIEGEAVHKLQDVFLSDWRFCSGQDLDEPDLFPQMGGPSLWTPVQIVNSGPDLDLSPVMVGYFSLIASATERIWITTPYLVPGESIKTALKVASLSGLDVRIIVPGLADHIFVFWASQANIDDLLAAGVRIFSYNNGFIHSKVVIVDGKAASVGTTNLDLRSFEINFEIQAFIYNKEVASRLEQDFMDDLTQCREFTLEERARKPFVQKTKEAVGRLWTAQV